jgi:hypothetical protein
MKELAKSTELLRVGSLTSSSILFTTMVVVVVVVMLVGTSQTPIKMILKNPPPLPLSTGEPPNTGRRHNLLQPEVNQQPSTHHALHACYDSIGNEPPPS